MYAATSDATIPYCAKNKGNDTWDADAPCWSVTFVTTELLMAAPRSSQFVQLTHTMLQ